MVGSRRSASGPGLTGRNWSPSVRATMVGLMAILLWSLMTGLVRVVADSFGATLGSALIYTCGAALLLTFRRPAPLRTCPRIYLIVGGLLFVFYESSISLSIGLASSASSSVEVSLVNYLWPTMMVLLAAAFVPDGGRHDDAEPAGDGEPDANDAAANGDSSDGAANGDAAAPAAAQDAPVRRDTVRGATSRHSRGRAVLRVLPGAIIATAGVVLAVGGNSGLDWALAARHVAANPLPYLLAFAGAFAWSVYAVFTPALSKGYDGTSVFFPFVAASLWIIHFASGQGWPSSAPSVWGYVAVVATAAVIAGGYACWGYGILRGSMSTLAMASYATPVLSTAASAVLLGLSLAVPFWCGALLVAAGSIINWWISSHRR
ncbi:drug/metabolite transporter permease [Bifidobacterium leontopitheci]|uniref:EamA domain-containing protein n=1 Tax=Bifidobacterium leontopitheci TaxID=2650774 RepID=A0A6I1GL09_9BIFI|nr:drug/metabolite transporter permease [Bifidobacterium leontopitheci]KAB7790149.1 hypothetical protein F7D09_1342 [Bifidobacterium leontopitheci]